MSSGDQSRPNIDTATEPLRVRFGSFAFDASTGELRRDGMLMHLQAQPARVLAHLVLHAGEVVSRDDLHHAVWGGETFVDFERGLNVCIAQIRSALGDESTSPHFIRTLPRRGYQFIYPVENVPIVASSAPDEHSDARQVSRRILFAVAIGLSFVAIVMAALNWRRIFSDPSVPILVAVAPFDNETGDAAVNGFSRSLTDNVVQQLASQGSDHYEVIGNAAVLRVPREERDLARIAATLKTQYIVLGQVQGSGTRIRILAHLIHMPEQTHVWVVRLEQPADDPFTLESTAAQDIATEFSRKLEAFQSTSKLHDRATH